MAYSAPANNAINFYLANSYSPPAADEVHFNLDERTWGLESLRTNMVFGPHKFLILSGMGDFSRISLLLGLGSELRQLILTPAAIFGVEKVLGSLSICQIYIQKLLNSLRVGDPLSGTEVLRGALALHINLQTLLLELSDSIATVHGYIQAQRNELSDDVQSLENILGSFALKDEAQSILKFIGSLTKLPALRPSCALEIYLNSRPILHKIISCSITLDRTVTFDTIQLTSTDSQFFSNVNDISEWPSLELEVIYQGTSWSFLIEDVTGGEQSFGIWGRSIAAKKSAEPFKEEITHIVESDQLASDLASDLVLDLAIDWQVVDWTITKGYTLTGTPINMLKELADSVGAVARATPDGTGVQIVRKFPTRPIDLPFAPPIASFDREVEITTLDLSCTPGDGSNSIVVFGQSLVDRTTLIFEAEDSCVVVGQLAYLKVYPAMAGVGYVLSSTGTDPVFERSYEEECDEVLFFISGKASVSRPIKELISIEWDGLIPAGGHAWTIGGSDIILEFGKHAVGRVKYKTSYDSWSAGHIGEGDLLVVLTQDKSSGIVARIYFGAGDREAESISKPNLTSLEAVEEAGKVWLDDNSYHKHNCGIKVPCTDIVDGQVIGLGSIPSGVEGNWVVLKHTISALIVDNTKKIWSELDACQFEQS